MSSKRRLNVDWCDFKAARYAVMNWHYSRSMPVGKTITLGAWWDEKFYGAILYSWGANHNIGSPYGLKMTEVAELVRVAIKKGHEFPVSQVLAVSQRKLVSQCPGLRLIVSYADTGEGHHGGIYQAAGWVYAGMTQVKFDFIADGKKLQRRAYTGTNYGQPKQELPANATPIKSPAKHRYLMPLDDAMRKQIEPLRKPYPKRVRSADGGTSGNQPEGGGSIPTRTLSQSDEGQSG